MFVKVDENTIRCNHCNRPLIRVGSSQYYVCGSKHKHVWRKFSDSIYEQLDKQASRAVVDLAKLIE